MKLGFTRLRGRLLNRRRSNRGWCDRDRGRGGGRRRRRSREAALDSYRLNVLRGDVQRRTRRPVDLADLLHVIVNHVHVGRQPSAVLALVDRDIILQAGDDLARLRSVPGFDQGERAVKVWLSYNAALVQFDSLDEG